jgi:hypothetical protein
VIAYTDTLAANGYTETAGDAANRDRYRGHRPPDLMTDEDDEPLTVHAETDSAADDTE